MRHIYCVCIDTTKRAPKNNEANSKSEKAFVRKNQYGWLPELRYVVVKLVDSLIQYKIAFLSLIDLSKHGRNTQQKGLSTDIGTIGFTLYPLLKCLTLNLRHCAKITS